MALPIISTLNTAVDNIYAALTARKDKEKARSGCQSLQECFGPLTSAYAPEVDFVVTDVTDATLTAFFATGSGELAVALARAVRVGDVFQVGGTGDTTDNALAGAKGSAVADGDLFEVTDVSTPTVVYLGAAGALDFTGEQGDDFQGV